MTLLNVGGFGIINVGQCKSGTVTLSGPAPSPDGAEVHVWSDIVDVTDPVIVQPGQNQQVFDVCGSGEGSGTVWASYNGVTKSHGVTVIGPQ